MPRPTNRLANETSPYLRQHAHNPVDWYPWGEAALARARSEDKPIFLSIGYSACHWCHVMEHECFEDAAIAALMNEHYVCIKVDREERPDLDEIYMAAVQAMTGQGGWPMSVWLTPDLEPFFGGTYFPPADAYGRPGFPRVLTQLAKAWRERRADVLRGAKDLTEHLRSALQPRLPDTDEPDDVDVRLVERSATRCDREHAGFGPAPQGAPTVPPAAELAVLRRRAQRGDDAARAIALPALDAMARGGIRDHLAGGFHRYSTDRQWLVPHFEKMLYDNAQLAEVYLDALLLTSEARYGEVARTTLDYMLAEMQGPDGGFYSSQDADSEGEEGRFFVWQRAEFDAVLGADAEFAARCLGVTAGGNWEHTNVLFAAADPQAVATELGLDAATAGERLQRAKATLLARRAQRVRPGTDDKVLAAWNGLAISACARGYQVLGDERYLRAAQRAATFVQERMHQGGRLLRSWHSGRAQHAAYLEDHAFVADALLTLFESDFDPRWLAAARAEIDAIRARFVDAADGNLWFTADDHERLLARSKSIVESSTPSGLALAVRAFVRAGLLLGDEALYAAGVRAMGANAAVLAAEPTACPSLVLTWQFVRGEPREVVIAGELAAPATQAMLRRLRTSLARPYVVAVATTASRATLAAMSETIADKTPVRGATTAYVCRHGSCEAPVTDAELFWR